MNSIQCRIGFCSPSLCVSRTMSKVAFMVINVFFKFYQIEWGGTGSCRFSSPMEFRSVCDNLESRNEGSSRSERSALIPGLPDDIVVSCLTRVPRRYHPHLKQVSKRWRELVCSKEWVSYRLKHHLAETWIYALCLNKSGELCIYMLDPNHLKRGWKLVHGLPSSFLKRKGVGFEVLGTKLFLFGGCGWVEDATSEVYFYDALTNMWSAAGCLSTPRYIKHKHPGFLKKSSNNNSFKFCLRYPDCQLLLFLGAILHMKL